MTRCCTLAIVLGAWLGQLTWGRASTYASHLDMWIAGKEVEQFVGEPMDIYVIKDGVVVPYLQDAYFGAQLPILPPEVETVEISWFAHDDVYRYRFSDLRSLDPFVMYNPLLSIPPNGILPRHQSAFKMSIPCTGRVTAVASMYIALHLRSSTGVDVPGSPIRLHLKKKCIAFEKRKACQPRCINGSRCSPKNGRCVCKRGFYGAQCKSAACFPLCLNNGSCVRPGECLCLDGFLGSRCETVICSKSCQNGGRCVHPNQCQCAKGYYGTDCEYKSGRCKGTCRNGGICTTENNCQCRPGYVGPFCKFAKCMRSCGAHGRCASPNQCRCQRGWRGRRCNKRRNKYPKQKTRRKRRGRHSQIESRTRRRRKTRRNRKRKKTTHKMPFKVQPTSQISPRSTV